ncbi:MAG: hypothetical protein K9L24_05110 [Spirochaetia bacterium]|nr:hypothetical protein [Spirochaetia bacterium]MCF7953508.1 hypothetical protein [Spirochaetales bacterium]
MKLSALQAAALTIVIIIGGVLISQSLGWWKTTSSKEPKLIEEGAFAGSYDPSDIRGSYAFSDIEDAFEIPSDLTAQAFGLPIEGVDTGMYQAKMLEEIFGDLTGEFEIGTDSIRWFTSLYTGLPHTPEETTLLPEPAVDILLNSGKIDEAVYQELQQFTISLDEIDGLSIEKAVSEFESTQISSDESETEESNDSQSEYDDEIPEIRGNTTFNDLLDYGISEGQIAETLDIADFSEIDSRMAVRDYCLENGLEFGDYRLKFEELATE